MLVLSSFNKLLSHVLAPPTLHTAVIFSPSGELIAFESSRARPKDDVRVLVGVASDIWAETRDDGEGMVESELGKIYVLPITPSTSEREGREGRPSSKEPENPVLLIALNATDDAQWGELQRKGQGLAAHISKPLQQLLGRLQPETTSHTNTTPTSPTVTSRNGRR
ncbi:terpenoid [Pyrrhoderma noxium]|uniref:Terpenoid n=1 Tax=Pyrrhoderma noxium TaxID=2282107 RepID=A0A286USW6_9AGAM|nr:terpenoid [Pyrrhoderma noxium]